MEGGNLTIYHENSKNVSFCAVQPPFSPGFLRSQFDNDHGNADVNITQVFRYFIKKVFVCESKIGLRLSIDITIFFFDLVVITVVSKLLHLASSVL